MSTQSSRQTQSIVPVPVSALKGALLGLAGKLEIRIKVKEIAKTMPLTLKLWLCDANHPHLLWS